MQYVPYSKIDVAWSESHDHLSIKLPWLKMDVGIDPKEYVWIKDATERLAHEPGHAHVQKFLGNLSTYPVSYFHPRSSGDFEHKDLCPAPELEIDSSTPLRLLQTVGVDVGEALVPYAPTAWSWNWQNCIEKAKIAGTDLYDPMTFISYLILHRLDWESSTWCGQDGLGKLMEKYLKMDEAKFFWIIGLISSQSWYVTMESSEGMMPALTAIPQAKEPIEHFMMDEAGHYKFMDMVFEDIGLRREDFSVFPETKWLLAAHKRMAEVSPLAFAAMINIFEAAFYEGQDPISRVLLQSSKPHAARGYDLHYKINQEHRHCDMPLVIGQHLGPQTREHLELTLAIFEFTLCVLDQAEARIDEMVLKQFAA